MTQQVLSMAEPVQKLCKLAQLLPGEEDIVHSFGEFLAGYFKSSTVSPEEFALTFELALLDLETGRDGFNKPINHRLVGSRELVYRYLRTRLAVIAETVFPKDFATAVKRVIDET